MRIFASIILIAGLAQGALAQGAPNQDAAAAPDSEMSQASESIMIFQEMQTRLEEAGYKDIEVSPDVYVIRAKDGRNRPVTLVINAETMVSVRIPPLDNEHSTTGSAPSRD